MHDRTFDFPPGTVVVTSTFVLDEGWPILVVSHELGEGGEHSWQFHCGNGDYHMSKMRLVRLDEIVRRDPSILTIADLPVGCSATRASVEGRWEIRSD